VNALDLDRATIEEFLFAEADLIDDGDFAAWLELFTDDGVYWIPAAGGDDPGQFVSIIFDDRAKLEARVQRLQSDLCWAQEPRSQVRHVIGNVRTVSAPDAGDAVVVRSNAVVVETRRQQQQILTTRNEHHLVVADGSIQIRRKRVDLLEADFFIGNLTFLI